MRKYMVLCLTAALLISGCLNQTNESADTSTETEEYVLSTPDTYKNLESFIYAYQTSDSPNIRSELPTERIYWINDNNPWKTSLKDIQVREDIFPATMTMDLSYLHTDFLMERVVWRQ